MTGHLRSASKEHAPGGAAGAPFISVVIATSDRPAHLDRCLASLAAVNYPRWELVIIDQSRTEAVREVVDSHREHLPPITYSRLGRQNASRARNRGAGLATASILAYLDDDCTVTQDWLHHVAAAFERHPGCGLVFGSVLGVDVDPRSYFVLTWEFEAERSLRGTKAITTFHGMGASMYFRREAFDQLKGFDLLLGPGARFQGSHDLDITYRALASGWEVVETPGISVRHHGTRAYRSGDASRRSRNYHFGSGALHIKMVRCGRSAARKVALIELWKRASNVRPMEAVAGRPTKLAALTAFLLGMAAGLTTPVNRLRMQFIERRDPLGLPGLQGAEVEYPALVPARALVLDPGDCGPD